ncbi:hypothetical protein BGW36DRAFT_415827 [Talaromyces proteolyticus]|uniref:Major facilitator superfamily (MFS) profile domain-containing protein n=1 Tax=Talaromyces proteolyticus TaxID=1131652 RepID=A0AAD4KU64_9EURO|nr:uncharacterized protein BGW36DRAFT_415827 [Talaromyces proteolyticus]KAH8700947.1 hypothetical protein BGW36DRAFT_415827 [Talaromyces proteolyticus]
MASAPETEVSVKPTAQLHVLLHQDQDLTSKIQPEKHEYTYADGLLTARQILFVGPLCTAMFTNQVGLGNTLATVNLIRESFGITNQGQLSWLIAGNSLTIGYTYSHWRKIGRRLVLAVVSRSRPPSVFVACSFCFGACILGHGSRIDVTKWTHDLGQSYSPGPRKNMSFAWVCAAAPFGAIAGFLFGGLFVLAEVAAFSSWTIPHLPGVTGVRALVLFNLAWDQAAVAGWKEPYAYVCLVIVCWAKSPILPLSAFNSDIAFVFACTATGWACGGIWALYILEVAIKIRNNTPFQMAAWFIAVIPVLSKNIPASWIMAIGQTAYLAVSILTAVRRPDSTYWTYFFFSVLIITVSIDISFSAATIIFSNAIPRQYQGMGASIVMTVINYNISLGLRFAGTIETNINGGRIKKADWLLGYRGALWFSVGLAVLGLALSFISVMKGH